MAISLKRAALSQFPSAQVSLGIIAAGAALVVGASVAWIHPPAEIFLLLCIGAVISIPLVFRAAQGQFDIFEPTVIFFLAWGVMFVLRPAVSFFTGDLVYSRPSREIDYSSTFAEMLVFALIGACAFLGGYSFFLGRRRSRARSASSPSAGAAVFVSSALAVVGVAGFAAFVIGAGGFGILLDGRSQALTAAIQDSSIYFLYAPFLLIPAGLAFLVLWTTTKSRVFLLLGLILLGIVLLRALPVGSRSHLLPLAMALVTVVYARQRLRPNVFQVAAIVLFGLTASSLLLVNRSAERSDDASVWRSLTAVMSQPRSLWAPILDGEDAAMSETLAVALLVTPEEMGHTYGKATVGDLMLRPIPRVLWSSKPESPRRQLIREIWPAEFAGEGTGGTANPEFSALLFWYMDFSWPGIMLGMGTYGFLFRRLYESFLRESESPWIRVFYGLTLGLLVIALRDSPVDTVARFMFIGAPLWFLLSLKGRVAGERGETNPAIYRGDSLHA